MEFAAEHQSANIRGYELPQQRRCGRLKGAQCQTDEAGLDNQTTEDAQSLRCG